jgi:hypothetical protein
MVIALSGSKTLISNNDNAFRFFNFLMQPIVIALSGSKR